MHKAGGFFFSRKPLKSLTLVSINAGSVGVGRVCRGAVFGGKKTGFLHKQPGAGFLSRDSQAVWLSSWLTTIPFLLQLTDLHCVFLKVVY